MRYGVQVFIDKEDSGYLGCDGTIRPIVQEDHLFDGDVKRIFEQFRGVCQAHSKNHVEFHILRYEPVSWYLLDVSDIKFDCVEEARGAARMYARTNGTTRIEWDMGLKEFDFGLTYEPAT